MWHRAVIWRNTASWHTVLQSLQLLPAWKYVLVSSLIPLLGVPWIFGISAIVFQSTVLVWINKTNKIWQLCCERDFKIQNLEGKGKETPKYSVFRNLHIWRWCWVAGNSLFMISVYFSIPSVLGVVQCPNSPSTQCVAIATIKKESL